MKKAVVSIIAIWVVMCSSFIIAEKSSAAHIVDSNPDINETDVPIQTVITIQFNTTMDRDSIGSNLVISPSLDPYGHRLEWSNNDRELMIIPNAELRYNQIYNISLDGAMDNSGNLLEDPFINFETESEPKVSEFKGWGSSTNLIWMIILIILCVLTGLWLGLVLAKRRIKSK